MNKQIFMEELKKGLAARGVADVEDIVSDYEEHFARKLADGYREEETAKKLGDPRALALEYAAEGETPARHANFPAALGVCALDLVVALLFAVGFAWVAGIGAGALAVAFIGICLIAAPVFPAGTLVIPYMPYIPGAMLGAALLALSVIFGVLAAYSCLLAKKSAAKYFRWQRSVVTGRKTPPYAVFPLAQGRGRRALRRVTLVSLLLFAAMVTLACVIMASLAGNVEFWHAWGWFGYVMQ